MSDPLAVPASSGGGQRALPDEDIHDALCVFVEPMGEAVDDFPGSVPKVSQKVRFFFETAQVLPESAGEYAGKPFMLSSNAITLSPHEKGNLSKLLKSWLGKDCPEKIVGYPLKSLVGRACRLNVAHKTKTDGGVRAYIAGVMPPSKNAPVLKRVAVEPPPWVEKERMENAAAVAAFKKREAMGLSGHDEDSKPDFDSVPF